MQETRVRSQVREDPTWHEATKPTHYSYWARALDPSVCNHWALSQQLLKPMRPRAHDPQEKPLLHSKRVAPARHSYTKAHTAVKTQHSQNKQRKQWRNKNRKQLLKKTTVWKTGTKTHTQTNGQDGQPRNKSTPLWSINLRQRRREYAMEKRQSLQELVLGKLDSSMWKGENRTLSHAIYENEFKMD